MAPCRRRSRASRSRSRRASPSPRRVVVAGASGLIGSALVASLRAGGDDARTLVRRPPRGTHEVPWDPAHGVLDAAALAGADAVVNLSGASVGRLPWTRAYRRELVASRVEPTRLLAETIVAMDGPRPALVNASAIGWYGDRPGELIDDDSPRGSGFMPDLVLAWEQAAAIAAGATRVVQLRSGVVVARAGGMAPIRVLTSAGLGARFGRGGQYWPWISLEDEVRAIRHVLASELRGPVILASPTPATSDEVGAAFAAALGRPRLFRVPAEAIRVLLGEAGERLLLDDLRVTPARLAADGFTWHHPTIRDAVDAAR